jgi:uncharacterized protein (DUF1810 family)
MPTDVFDLNRFVEAQARDYAIALGELQRGQKRSHWIWYVLPQMKGLGWSEMSQRYGIGSLAEARAYLAHPVLGPRLIECVEAILEHTNRSAAEILGHVDAMKLRSCLTLFAQAAPEMPVFAEALAHFFDGSPDEGTLRLLANDAAR